MPTDVVMPQMGESIAEGTIVRWIKKVGDAVDRDEPLFEISTDKVDAEIPSPAAGVLAEIKVQEGETVPVNAVVALIGEASEAIGREEPGPVAEPHDGQPAQAPESEPAAVEAAGAGPDGQPQPSPEDARRQKSSPAVRKIAREHQVDLSHVRGTGIGGRVTREDILSYLESRPAARPGPAPPAARQEAPGEPGTEMRGPRPGERVEVAPLSVMRRKIAEHMVTSRRISAHVHSVFEVDFSRIAQIRAERRSEYERAGIRLTYLAFIAKAVVDALRATPIVNASLDGDNIIYKRDINLGIAVALDWGLIVPVIRNAGEKNVLGLARAINDLGDRARSKQLRPEEVQDGTFTITNPGVFGALFGMPIINQPQVAILGVGAIEKRPVVIGDAIGIRPMAYLTLGYDHRLIDGAVADQFMSLVKRTLEQFDPAGL
jgi:pyruvate dehydrogenase E2 component (dihydrolipoamide acetyltransferase)